MPDVGQEVEAAIKEMARVRVEGLKIVEEVMAERLTDLQVAIETPLRLDLLACRREGVRLRAWLDLIANDDGDAAHLYRAWAQHALNGDTP